MNNESTCHQPSTLTIDSLSYKELQSLAMSLSLPGKMKQGVLVEAIKARQNNNEEAVEMILEANRQRRLLRREQHLRSKQQQILKEQQLLKLKDDKDNNMMDNQANCLVRSKMKRSAGEMEMDQPPYVVCEDMYKRSKLAAALIQQPRQQQQPRGYCYTSLAATPRKENQYQQTMMGGCSTWEQQQQQQQTFMSNTTVPSLVAMQQKSLPVLSKELSILPVLSDCSSNGINSSSNDSLCCNVGGVSATGSATSCWKPDNTQQLPQSSFESCDSGWIGTDDSYDLNTWKNVQNVKLLNNHNNFENAPPSLHTNPNSSNSYFDATAASNTSIDNGEIYTPDDYVPANNSNSSSVTLTASNYTNADFPLESSNSFQEINIKQEPSCSPTWCESFVQQTQSFQQQPLSQCKSQQTIMQNDGGRNGFVVCSNMSAKDCPYDFDCYRLGGPFFRIQRPGNPSSVVVTSGRSSTLTTFCNMLPRIASYIQ